MKRLCAALAAALTFGSSPAALAVDPATPATATEHVVLSTEYGDLVLALYPGVAPRHVVQILNLVTAGAYDSVPIDRVIPGFIVQIGEVRNRLNPLPPEKAGLDKPIKGEFSAELRHLKGTLSMARWEEADSATSSFSILLNAAPHLDRKYTIFGHLESGGSVVDRILAVPRDGERPKTPVVVLKARVVEDIDAYYLQHPRDPIESMGDPSQYASRDWVAYILAAMVLLGLFSFFFFEKLSKRQLLSLHMLNVLAGSFALFVFVVPVGHDHPWLAALVFAALPLLFKFMNRFESGN